MHLSNKNKFYEFIGINPSIRNIVRKQKKYSEDEIYEIAHANNLAVIDCLKDDNIICLENLDNNGELGGVNLFEFDRIEENKFLLRWSEFDS